METTLRDRLAQRGSQARHAPDDWAWPGWEGGSTPAGGTGVVPSRRPGGPAPQWWQRRPRRPPVTPQTHPRTDGLDRRGAVVGGRTSGAWPPGPFRPGRWPGGTPQPRTLPERRFSGGSKGGGSTPRQSANVKHRVGWLTDLKSVQPALGGAAETASQSTVRSSVHRAVAGKLLRLLVEGLTDGEGDGRPRHLPGDGSALCGPPLFALPLPLGNPRSSI